MIVANVTLITLCIILVLQPRGLVIAILFDISAIVLVRLSTHQLTIILLINGAQSDI